jgi:hypothetical protein
MITLTPVPPFVWPEPRVTEGLCDYEHAPVFGELALRSQSVFGITSGLTAPGVETIAGWLKENPTLKACLLVMPYPASCTRETEFARLLELVAETGRLEVRVRPQSTVTNRATNILCFLMPGLDRVYLAIGPTEDIGLTAATPGQINLLFRADAVLVETFKNYFDWLWAHSAELNAETSAQIPNLKLPEGTEEAAQLWATYLEACSTAATDTDPVVKVDPETGAVSVVTADGESVTPATELLGLKKLDELAQRVAQLYERGSLVSVDKLSRIPPLDAPLDPSIFGDTSELHRGNVVRTVRMRVSIIDEKTLKEIEKRRNALRPLLTRFTFGLADNMRWMPTGARELLEAELKRINEDGQKVIGDILKGDVEKFIESKKDKLIADINAMHETLGRPGKVTEDVIEKVVASLKTRLTKAQTANFMPTLSYSVLGFAATENESASPWGQAFSLLADVADFPRKALTDGFFFRGLKVPEDDLIDAMNIADDPICNERNVRNIKERCRDELAVLSRIEASELAPRQRCGLVSRLISGSSAQTIAEELEKLEKESKDGSPNGDAPATAHGMAGNGAEKQGELLP